MTGMIVCGIILVLGLLVGFIVLGGDLCGVRDVSVEDVPLEEIVAGLFRSGRTRPAEPVETPA